MITRWKNSILERTGPWVWFFLFYAVWGFFTLDDFGVHLDEITQRTIGMENNRFLSGRVGFDKVEQHKFFGSMGKRELLGGAGGVYRTLENEVAVAKGDVVDVFCLWAVAIVFVGIA